MCCVKFDGVGICVEIGEDGSLEDCVDEDKVDDTGVDAGSRNDCIDGKDDGISIFVGGKDGGVGGNDSSVDNGKDDCDGVDVANDVDGAEVDKLLGDDRSISVLVVVVCDDDTIALIVHLMLCRHSQFQVAKLKLN